MLSRLVILQREVKDCIKTLHTDNIRSALHLLHFPLNKFLHFYNSCIRSTKIAAASRAFMPDFDQLLYDAIINFGVVIIYMY